MTSTHVPSTNALALSGLALGGLALGGLALSPWLRTRVALKASLVKRFVGDGIIKDDQSASFTEWWSRMKTMYFICWLEENHQLNILEAGGEEAVEEDPTLLFRSALPHLRHIKQMKEMQRKIKGGKGGDGGGDDGEMEMEEAGPVIKDLVLLGGGHSHVHVLKMLGMAPIKGVRVTLITRDVDTPYSGMLPGYVAGAYAHDECHIDLVRLARFGGAKVIHAEACGIDLANKKINLVGRPPIGYDVLSINIGCSPRMSSGDSGYEKKDKKAKKAKPGLSAVTPVKPIDGFAKRWELIVDKVKAITAPKHFCVVGAGAGGMELALSMQHRLRNILRQIGKPEDWVKFTLLGRSDHLMPSHAPGIRSIFQRLLQERGIALLTGAEVVDVQVHAQLGGPQVSTLVLKDGRRVQFDECLWCTEGAPQAWLTATGLGLEGGSGFLAVRQTMQCTIPSAAGDDGLPQVATGGCVFAAGDVASIIGFKRPKVREPPPPRPHSRLLPSSSPLFFHPILHLFHHPPPSPFSLHHQAGVFAVMAGMPLAENLRRYLEGRPLVNYTPQSEWLGLIGTGDGMAVASRGRLALPESQYLWELKDWIDRKWMWNYTGGLPLMGMDPEKERKKNDKIADDNAVAKFAGDEALELLSHASMRCGGCGAKVGATVLERTMQRLLTTKEDGTSCVPTRPEVLLGLDAPDDCAVVQLLHNSEHDAMRTRGASGRSTARSDSMDSQEFYDANSGSETDFSAAARTADEAAKAEYDGPVSVHSVDFFRELGLGDDYLLGRISAIHALSDCHAMNAQPQTALAMVVLPLGTERALEETLFQMMVRLIAADSSSG
jgi:NADH dehydrogenase FAD-containing subunit